MILISKVPEIPASGTVRFNLVGDSLRAKDGKLPKVTAKVELRAGYKDETALGTVIATTDALGQLPIAGTIQLTKDQIVKAKDAVLRYEVTPA